jgi:hypothetical protein
MSTQKVSATLDDDIVDEIRKTVGPRGFSRFLSEAARDRLQRMRILALLDEMDAKQGPPDARARKLAEKRIARVLQR